MNKRVVFATLVALATFALTLTGWSEDKIDHPLKVLKAKMNNDAGRSSIMSSRGSMTVWLQNLADVPVDGVKMEVILYNDRNRPVETLTREIGELDAGKKEVLTFKWDVLAERSVKPRIFVYYNGGEPEPTKFEGEPPVW